jgi:hypothetical protein
MCDLLLFLKSALQANTSMLLEMSVANLAQTIARHQTTVFLSAAATQVITGHPKIPRTCLALVSCNLLLDVYRSIGVPKNTSNSKVILVTKAEYVACPVLLYIYKYSL